ncbi:MAG: rhomboid family intramembrane serine protease [Saprospiraceae bacterium]
MSITLLIIIVTCIVSYLGFQNRQLFQKMMHHPVSESRNGEWYRMITSGLLHADLMHLGINMYVLWGFGQFIESIFTSQYGNTFGRLIYLIAYILMIILADIPSFIKHKNNAQYSAIGASGAVSGILFMFILWMPWQELRLYFAIPIPAIIFGVLYLVYSSWASKKSNDNIGHDAHFWGAIAGIAILLISVPKTLGVFIEQLTTGFPF